MASFSYTALKNAITNSLIWSQQRNKGHRTEDETNIGRQKKRNLSYVTYKMSI